MHQLVCLEYQLAYRSKLDLIHPHFPALDVGNTLAAQRTSYELLSKTYTNDPDLGVC